MTDTVIAKIQSVAMAALGAAERLVSEWLPEGERQGSEWVARNSARSDRTRGSFGISLVTGKWNDFADNDAHGGDLVSLLSYLRGCRQVDAAIEIDRQLRLDIFRHTGACQERRNMPSPWLDKVSLGQQVEAERRQVQQQAAALAKRLWRISQPAYPRHPYLIHKEVPRYLLRQSPQGQLLVPLYAEGQLVNLQCINAQGDKRFLKGGQVYGAYSPLGRIAHHRQLYVCEGWATGATLHAYTREPVACAMNAGNLKPVAKSLRARYPGLDIVIAGDDDRQTPGNPGLMAANEAALAIGALVVLPVWPEGVPDSLSDFNDLARWYKRQGGGHE
ncbi:toprim domain-containing protein [Halomonas caseinilytica]|uniref:toprim domain-containing protein n=1 Tax=Halomonas caseinilytica TaxID=438744 RepID=UPI0007E5505D|nr:toprim domain-containing protein [Halomonas caseinilytica]SEM10594.1 putative DNA primase/helicase [Halomonas caseinilytica]